MLEKWTKARYFPMMRWEQGQDLTFSRSEVHLFGSSPRSTSCPALPLESSLHSSPGPVSAAEIKVRKKC